MNELTANRAPSSQNGTSDFKIKVIGVGGAGSNALDRLILDGSINIDLVACNTDVQALAGSVATQKVQLGRHVTRGLGAGATRNWATRPRKKRPIKFAACSTASRWWWSARVWAEARAQARPR